LAKKNIKKSLQTQESNFLLYKTDDGAIKVEVVFHGETIWLTQIKMAELFDVDIRTVSEHLQNVFKAQELSQESVIRKFRNTAEDGKSYETQFYNLDAIISVGYRVNSVRATQFRIWAMKVLSKSCFAAGRAA
jgi:hypothetical protein